MYQRFREGPGSHDLIYVAVGLAVGLAIFDLIQAVVVYLIAPLISVFVGSSTFELNAFTIGTSEFRYGAVVQAALTLLMVIALVYALARLFKRGFRFEAGVESSMRMCPECIGEIPAAAKRCPFCTAAIDLDR
ncbi:MAG TPA: MscL family protein [Solirubrobacterales bacterium]|jgi:large conductance mechanosensitive channel|nr:MscL family protein [Solirubrobacterales bacterium]